MKLICLPDDSGFSVWVSILSLSRFPPMLFAILKFESQRKKLGHGWMFMHLSLNTTDTRTWAYTQATCDTEEFAQANLIFVKLGVEMV